MGDTLEMQIQQVAARTGQIRGTWVSGISYSFGDVVQDGANGLNSGNYYMCAIANTSSVWTTDIAAGYWSLAIQSTIPVTSLPISIANGGTGSTTAAAARTALGSTTVGDAVFIASSASAARTALGLGTSSVINTGTSGATIPLLNGANTWSGVQTFNSSDIIVNDLNGGQLGGFRNKLINGDFRRWDYGTTYALTTSAAYGSANRWASIQLSSAAGIFNQDTSITAGLGFTYNGKVGRNNGSALTNSIYLIQALETSNSIPMAGKAVTLSFYAKCGTTYSPTASGLSVTLQSGTGTNQSVATLFGAGWTGAVAVISQTATLTTSWQRFQYTGTLNSSITQLVVILQMSPIGTASTDDNFYITGVQLEPGSVATPFEDIGEGETLLQCLRYAPIFGAVAGPIGDGASTSTSASGYFIPFRVPTRIAPTGLSINTVGDLEAANFAGVDAAALTGLTFSKGGLNGAFVTATSGTSLTSSTSYLLYVKTALTGNLVFTGVEL